MTIYVHIGHGKTGSSALQSFLAINQKVLKEKGVIYPEHNSFKDAESGNVTSGNGNLILKEYFTFKDKKNYLFSNENLFQMIGNEKKIELILSKCKKPQDLVLICYTRNLFDFYFSAWGQYIKRGRGVLDVNEYACEFRNFYSQILDYFALSEKYGFKFILRNYSNHKIDLVDDFLSQIPELRDTNGLDFSSIRGQRINRSLSKSEYVLQRYFNKYYSGKSSRFISDPLVNQLPDVKSEKFKISVETYHYLKEKFDPIFQQVNTCLESHEQLMIEEMTGLVEDNSSIETYSFTEQQLDVFVKEIVNKLSVLLTNDDVDNLRDLAIKIEKDSNYNLEESLKLMSIAEKGRPEGVFIARKVKSYKNKLKKN